MKQAEIKAKPKAPKLIEHHEDGGHSMECTVKVCKCSPIS